MEVEVPFPRPGRPYQVGRLPRRVSLPKLQPIPHSEARPGKWTKTPLRLLCSCHLLIWTCLLRGLHHSACSSLI